MTKEEVEMFADQVTYGNQRTELTLKNGKTINGHFYKNADPKVRNKNQWNFVVLPQTNPSEKKTTLFNGNDIVSIKIHEV